MENYMRMPPPKQVFSGHYSLEALEAMLAEGKAKRYCKGFVRICNSYITADFKVDEIIKVGPDGKPVSATKNFMKHSKTRFKKATRDVMESYTESISGIGCRIGLVPSKSTSMKFYYDGKVDPEYVHKFNFIDGALFISLTP